MPIYSIYTVLVYRYIGGTRIQGEPEYRGNQNTGGTRIQGEPEYRGSQNTSKIQKATRGLVSKHPAIYLSVYPSVHLSVYLSICLTVFLSIYISVYHSICLYISPSFCKCVYLFPNTILLNLERIFIPHFSSQFHDLGYKKFLICS